MPLLILRLISWLPTVFTLFTSFGLAAKLLTVVGLAGPLLGSIAPFVKAVADGFGKIVGLFFDGVEKVFYNPTTLIVCVVCLGGGYWLGGNDEKAKAPKPAIHQKIKAPPVKAKVKPVPTSISVWPFS